MEMAVHEWLHCKSPVSSLIECLNSLQSGANKSLFLGIVLKNDYLSLESLSYIHCCNNLSWLREPYLLNSFHMHMYIVSEISFTLVFR